MDLTIADFKDRHKGERGFILGNGGSLPVDKLNLLDPFITIGVNRTHKVYRSTYFCAIDEKWLRECDFPPERIFTAQRRPKGVMIPCVSFNPKDPKEGRWWSRDLASDGIGYRNSGIFAIQIAHWMGLSPIYLLGFDGDGTHFDGTQAKTVPATLEEIVVPRQEMLNLYTCTPPEQNRVRGIRYRSLEEAVEDTKEEARQDGV